MENFEGEKCVGLRETLRAAADGNLKEIFLADDTDAKFSSVVKEVSARYNIPLRAAASCEALGKRAGIEVAAGVVGILYKNPKIFKGGKNG